LAHGVALVVSPLVALMADQVAQQASSVRGAFLSGQQSSSEAAGVIRRLLARELDVLYVAPERLMSARFVDLLRRVPIAFACVDEAHCVAAWSHNFRPCYMRLRAVLCDELRVGTLLAVTATATRATEARICASLGIGNVVRRSAARPNLRLAVSRELNRHTALVALLRGALKDARALIVYCAFKRQADEVAELLAQHEFDAASYHGDKSAEERTRVQRRFQKGQLRVVVATVAFGMGLNKLDVDGVVHFTMPRSLEHYVQETGRAGRDGRAAYCHVFLDDDDYTHLRSVTHSDCVDERALASFVRQVAPSGAARGAAVSVPAESAAEQLDVRAPVVDTLLAVLEERGVVRRLAPTLATCRMSFVDGAARAAGRAQSHCSRRRGVADATRAAAILTCRSTRWRARRSGRRRCARRAAAAGGESRHCVPAGDAGVRVRARGTAQRRDRGRAGAVHDATRVGAGAQARLRVRPVQAHGGGRGVERAGEHGDRGVL
jgi:ATP-dependent DNA helicase Q4